MLDWQQRVVEEREALWIKVSKLRLFLDDKPSIEQEDFVLLSLQLSYMNNYCNILDERIARFNS